MRTHHDTPLKIRTNLQFYPPLSLTVYLIQLRTQSNCQALPTISPASFWETGWEIPNPKPTKDFQRLPATQAIQQNPKKGSAAALPLSPVSCPLSPVPCSQDYP